MLVILLAMLLDCGCDPALATTVPLRGSVVALTAMHVVVILATMHVMVMILRVVSSSVVDITASVTVAQLRLDAFQEWAQYIDEFALGKIEVPVKQIEQLLFHKVYLLDIVIKQTRRVCSPVNILGRAVV